jgi:uncharacterized lipoprotein
MLKKLFYSLSCFLLTACADSGSDKYRDIKHLEFPPELAIEHKNTSSYGTSYTDVNEKPKAESTKPEAEVKSADGKHEADVRPEAGKPEKPPKNASADLARLIKLVGDADKPRLQLKTGFERAWDLIAHGLSLAEIEVVDRNHDTGFYRVRFVANAEGKQRGLMDSLSSFFSDTFADTEYTLTLEKDKSPTEVRADKVIPANPAENPDKKTFNRDDSGALIKLLQKTIIDDLAN